MQMIVDFVLLAASVAAAVYCFVLSTRLKKLNDMRSGFGATLASMSAMLDQTRLMLEHTKRINIEGESKLRLLVEDAERIAPELECLLDAVAESAEAAAGDIERLRRAALADIEQRLGEQRRVRAPAPQRRSELAA